MHKHFPDWYRIIAVQATGEMLTERWAAVEAIAEWEKRTELLSLVRLIRGGLPQDAEICGKVIAAARATDTAFSARDNEAELRILAGAALVEILREPSSQADLLSLSLVASSFQDTVGDELVHEFVAFARQYLSDEAVRIRASGDRPEIAASMDLATLTTFVSEQSREFYAELNALREESNMFWWVFSAYSRDLSRPFSAIGIGPSCLIAAKELADLTEVLPGPRSAPALLEHVLAGLGKKLPPKIDLGATINATPADWRKLWLTDYPPMDVIESAPLLRATKTSLETDDPSGWLSLFTKATGVTELNVAPPMLAFQAYCESLLVRAAAQVKA